MTNENKMENKTQMEEKVRAPAGNEKPVEILVGFKDSLYHFGISGDKKKEDRTYLSTNDWDNKRFYEAGKMAAGELYRSGNTNYKIVNGSMNEVVYDIPKEKAEYMIKKRCDDPFWSGGEPPSHLERITCRELMPEQMEVFKGGLEYQTQVLQGKIKEPEKAPPRQNPLEIYAQTVSAGIAVVKALMLQNYDEDWRKDAEIKERKYMEAMLSGKLDLSQPKKQ